jgi:hypothetical protein
MEEIVYKQDLDGVVEDILAKSIQTQVEKLLPVRVSNV